MMVFRSLRIQLIWRVGLLLLLGIATIYLAAFTPFWLSAIWTGLAFMGIGWALIRFLERRHRHLEQFLQAISQADFSQQTQIRQDPMAPLYGQVRDLLSQLRSERASQHTYLQQVVEHIDIALIGFDDAGEISLINQAARNLLQKPYLHRIQSMAQSHPALWTAIQQARPGTPQLVEIEQDAIPKSLAIQSSQFTLLERPHQLVSLQDISRELQQRELDAWEKLIRVITHEINN
ncbi:MAG: hypothetical protein AAFV07_08510, partial [Bacteroidota bacterium]